MEDQNYRSDFEEDNVENNPNLNSENNTFNKMSSSSEFPPRMKCHEYEKTIQNLMEKIDVLEHRMKLIGEQKVKVVSLLKDMEEENGRLKDEISSRNEQNNALETKNKKFETEIKNLKSTNKNLVDQNKFKIETMNKELEEREKNLHDLNRKIKAKDESIKFYSVNNKLTQQYSNNYKEDLDKQIKTNKKLHQEITSLKKQIENLYIQKQNEGSLLLEIEHLKDDNVRLLQMLKSTEQFKDFSYLGQTGSGGIRYIRPKDETLTSPSSTKSKSKFNRQDAAAEFRKNPSRAKSSQNYAKYKENQEYEKTKNKVNWVPNEAYEYATQFRNKYNLDMSDIIMENLLSNLNKIWQNRMRSEINHVKTTYQNEIKSLKVQLHALTGGGIKENTKTKGQSNIAKIFGVPSTMRSKAEKDAARNVAFMNTQRCLENEIKGLKRKLAEKNGKFSDKNLDFNHGSLWMGERCTSEMKNLVKNLNDVLAEYESKVKIAMREESNKEYYTRILNNSAEWFFTSVKGLVDESSDKIRTWTVDVKRNLSSLKYAPKQYE